MCSPVLSLSLFLVNVTWLRARVRNVPVTFSVEPSELFISRLKNHLPSIPALSGTLYALDFGQTVFCKHGKNPTHDGVQNCHDDIINPTNTNFQEFSGIFHSGYLKDPYPWKFSFQFGHNYFYPRISEFFVNSLLPSFTETFLKILFHIKTHNKSRLS